MISLQSALFKLAFNSRSAFFTLVHSRSLSPGCDFAATVRLVRNLISLFHFRASFPLWFNVVESYTVEPCGRKSHRKNGSAFLAIYISPVLFAIISYLRTRTLLCLVSLNEWAGDESIDLFLVQWKSNNEHIQRQVKYFKSIRLIYWRFVLSGHKVGKKVLPWPCFYVLVFFYSHT